MHLSIVPPSSLLISMALSCSLPVNGLLALPLKLWLIYLILFTISKQKALGAKVCARAEPHLNEKQVRLQIMQSWGSQCNIRFI